MPVRSVKVTTREVEGLKCPFTGDTIDVYMHVQLGSITYSAPNAFTLREPVKGLDRLLDRASMRNGVAGAVEITGTPTDPYTGEPLTLRDFGDGRFCYAGGFNPRAAHDSLSDLVRKLRMRGGVSEGTRACNNVRVMSGKPSRRAPRAKDVDLSEDTLKAATEALEKTGAFGKKTTVHVTRGGARR